MIEKIKTNPDDRRLIVSAWNPAEIENMALPPCHMIFQFFVSPQKELSLHMFQRSCDMFLGVPFNIASYALLLHMIAQVTNTIAKECIITLGDVHIYHDHFDAVKTQLAREPKSLPTLKLNEKITDINKFTMHDISLAGYEHHGTLFAPLLTKDIKVP